MSKLFHLALKKMYKNKWMTACLFFGCFLLVAISSSIPIYSSAVTGKMLIKDLDALRTASNKHAGQCYSEIRFGDDKKTDTLAKYTKSKQQHDDLLSYGSLNSYDVLTEIDMVMAGRFRSYLGLYAEENNKSIGVPFYVSARRSIEEKLKVSAGRMYEKGVTEDGLIEVVLTADASKRLGIGLEGTYNMVMANQDRSKETAINIKVVGIVEPIDPSDYFWYDNFYEKYTTAVMTDYDTLMNDIAKRVPTAIRYGESGFIFDYTQVKGANADELFSDMKTATGKVQKVEGVQKTYMPAFSVLKSFSSRKDALIGLILLLDVPMIAVLIFYIGMISKLVAGYDENEVTVLKSRGATSFQILKIYLYECGIIAAVAAVFGIIFAFFISSMVGYSNGFLDFVQRRSLRMEFSSQIIFYALMGILVFTMATITPIMLASRKNILSHKQSQAAAEKTPLWQILCIDIILIAASLYGLSLFNEAQTISSTVEGVDVKSTNPLVVLMSSMFIAGCCLLLVRLYPWLIKLIHRIGRRFWSAALHMSLLNLSRKKRMGKTVILFLMFTISVGIFSAGTARTINMYAADSINYKNGADYVVTEMWQPTGLKQVFKEGSDEPFNITYYTSPPPYDRYEKVEGVEATARVYNKDKLTLESLGKRTVRNATMTAVVPDEFAKVAWFRDDLLPYHINAYLDLLAKNPEGCLITKAAEEKGYNVGDSITVVMPDNLGNPMITLTVLGVVEYFPTLDPNNTGIPQKIDGETSFFGGTNSSGGKNESNENVRVIANMEHIFRAMFTDKYEVWMKRAEGATTEQIYKSMDENGIEALNITNTPEQIVSEVKNDSTVQGMNGTLSLGFIVSMLVTAVGFMIYWIVDVKGRSLQFSVLRSMGISRRSLYALITFEELLTSLYAAIGGLIIGGVTSVIFIKTLSMHLGFSQQIIPFKTIIANSDYVRIFVIVALLIIACLAVIITILSRLNIANTLKLGED